VGYCCPSLLQIKYPSGARVHQMYSHPSEFLIGCKDMVMDPGRTALVLMEVPNSLQLLHCFYVDWDMQVSDFAFPGGVDALPEDEKLEYVRRVAMGTPEAICRLLMRAGYLGEDDAVQVHSRFTIMLVRASPPPAWFDEARRWSWWRGRAAARSASTLSSRRSRPGRATWGCARRSSGRSRPPWVQPSFR
jgi:hypothetical protein